MEAPNPCYVFFVLVSESFDFGLDCAHVHSGPQIAVHQVIELMLVYVASLMKKSFKKKKKKKKIIQQWQYGINFVL